MVCCHLRRALSTVKRRGGRGSSSRASAATRGSRSTTRIISPVTSHSPRPALAYNLNLSNASRQFRPRNDKDISWLSCCCHTTAPSLDLHCRLVVSRIGTRWAQLAIRTKKRRKRKKKTNRRAANMLTTFAAGPIPTSISKPSGCNDHFIVAADVGAVTSQVTTHWRMEFPKVNKYGSTCDPGSYVSAVQLTQNPVFSPGSACPTGYEPKCTFVPDDATIAANASSTLTRWPGLAHTDMAIGCCLTYVFYDRSLLTPAV